MRTLFLLALIPLAGCSLPEPAPPAAEFLVADASTTYWVRSSPRGISARTSPLILTAADDRFYEVYVGEVIRSYQDAVFTREPIYTRDLLSGDSRLLFEDKRISDWEKTYLSANPAARLLDPQEDVLDDVSYAATGEAEILAVAGPYVVYDRWVTLERADFQESDSARGAIDIRSGKSVSLSAVTRDSLIRSAGAVRDGSAIRWRHSGYDVIARWDQEREESEVVLRSLRGHEWPLGYVNARLPRIYWLDQPRMDQRLRAALAQAFEDARADDVETQLVRDPGAGSRGRLPATGSPRGTRGLILQ